MGKSASKFGPLTDLDPRPRPGNPNLRGLGRGLNMLGHRSWLWMLNFPAFHSIKLMKFHLNCRWNPSSFYVNDLHSFAMLYINSSERKGGGIQLAWTGLDTWPLRCRCSTPTSWASDCLRQSAITYLLSHPNHKPLWCKLTELEFVLWHEHNARNWDFLNYQTRDRKLCSRGNDSGLTLSCANHSSLDRSTSWNHAFAVSKFFSYVHIA